MSGPGTTRHCTEALVSTARPAPSSATATDSARAPMIRHFAGSSSREYSSSSGDRSGCGSGQRASPPRSGSKRRVDGDEQVRLHDHLHMVPGRSVAAGTRLVGVLALERRRRRRASSTRCHCRVTRSRMTNRIVASARRSLTNQRKAHGNHHASLLQSLAQSQAAPRAGGCGRRRHGGDRTRSQRRSGQPRNSTTPVPLPGRPSAQT